MTGLGNGGEGSPLISLGARTFCDFWGMDGRGSSEDSSAQVVLILGFIEHLE